MLKVSGLNQYYGSSQTLRDISFAVPNGACTVLLGRNGVGKTTLLKCLMGAIAQKGGAIEFDGSDVAALAPYQRAARGMAYVPQGREIFARLSVLENLQMGLAVKKSGAVRDIPDEVFAMFPVLKDMQHRRGGDLSGGQQQQLAIARALVSKPKLLILDEPTEGIQPSIIKDIERVIRMLASVAIWRFYWSSSTTILRVRWPITIWSCRADKSSSTVSAPIWTPIISATSSRYEREPYAMYSHAAGRPDG